MCTSIAFVQPALFGRNLDLDVSFGQQIAIAPRELPLPFHRRPTLHRHLAMIGMANRAGEYPLYAEAMNEKGLYMAGLYFPGNAHYFSPGEDLPQGVAPYELIPLVLGSCSTLAQARALLDQVQVVALPLGEGYPLAPLHWHIADATGSLAAEPTPQGLVLYQDPLGVLTNNPPFPYQTMNLNNYLGLSPAQPENTFAPQAKLAPYGQGMGALGLPGDASPMSRFVRAAFLKSHCTFTRDRAWDLEQFFHVLEGVAMVRGTVLTGQGAGEETLYSCCLDPATCTYYYKTYGNSALHGVQLTPALCRGGKLKTLALHTRSQVFMDRPC